MDSVLAGKLIERISNFTDYNVNIMDENGILVASRMKERDRKSTRLNSSH